MWELIEEIGAQIAEIGRAIGRMIEPAIAGIGDAGRAIGAGANRFARATDRGIRRGARAVGRAAVATADFIEEQYDEARRSLRRAHRTLEEWLRWIKIAIFVIFGVFVIMILTRAYLPQFVSVEATQNVLCWMALIPIFAGFGLGVIYVQLDHLLAVGAVAGAIKILETIGHEKTNELASLLRATVANLKKLAMAAIRLTFGGLVLLCLALYFVPLENDPGLVLLDIVLGIGIVIFHNYQKMVRAMQFAILATILVFFWGGRSEATKTIRYVQGEAKSVTKDFKLANLPSLNLSATSTPALADYPDPIRKCTDEERAPIDVFDAKRTDLAESDGTVDMRATPSCFAKITLPSFSANWWARTKTPRKDTDRYAIAYPDPSSETGLRIVVAPVIPGTSKQTFGAWGTRHDTNTLYVWSNTDLTWYSK